MCPLNRTFSWPSALLWTLPSIHDREWTVHFSPLRHSRAGGNPELLTEIQTQAFFLRPLDPHFRGDDTMEEGGLS